MTRYRSIRSLSLLFAFAACSPAPATDTAATDTAATAMPAAPVDLAAMKDAIQAREKEWSAAYLAANAAAVAALYTEDAAQVQAAGDWVRGREAITKSMQAQFDTVAVTAREDITEEVTPVGDYILEIGRYSYDGSHKVSKKPVSGAGRYMVLWRKDADGTWRLHRDIGNDAPTKS